MSKRQLHDFYCDSRVKAINKFMDQKVTERKIHQGRILNDLIIIAKVKPRFRICGLRDVWAKYTPKTLATAFNEGRVWEYYEEQLRKEYAPTKDED